MDDIEKMEYDSLLVRFKDILKHNSLKFTKQREAVLKTLYNHDEHFTPESLYLLIKQEYPNLGVGIATIYRTLNLLEESGIVTSLSFGSSGKKYELGNKPHHDHIICTNCGKITEFSDDEIEKKQLEIAFKYNFKLTGHIMQLYGVCETCQKLQEKEK
ncbi:Fur family transcriptional regulator [Sulfurospirillum sp. 1307]|jgi:Fur family ferric uptake transcriptional regulator